MTQKAFELGFYSAHTDTNPFNDDNESIARREWTKGQHASFMFNLSTGHTLSKDSSNDQIS